MPSRLVLALGGNALIQPGERGTVPEQLARAFVVAELLASLPEDTQLVVTHGNGPQVGRILLRSDLCLSEDVPPIPVDLAVAATQGEIGLMLQQALTTALARPVTGVLSRVLVDSEDPDFQSPSKYIGPFYVEDEARLRAHTLGWTVKEDPGRGWRRVVPSPKPLEVLDLAAVRLLLEAGHVVLACGGGGVPFVDFHGRRTPVEAVVDKDRASALLANQLDADELVILTGVDEVMVDFGTPQARALREVDAASLRAHYEAGQFPAGSMGPKVEAVLDFLERGGPSALITSPRSFADALAGRRGTRVHP
ncbi:MAG: carbamate kinase [Myxococcota bacterium]|nr:carbamate kinase [Myxococcota bacterium]